MTSRDSFVAIVRLSWSWLCVRVQTVWKAYFFILFSDCIVWAKFGGGGVFQKKVHATRYAVWRDRRAHRLR